MRFVQAYTKARINQYLMQYIINMATIIVLSITQGVASVDSKFYEGGLYREVIRYRKTIDTQWTDVDVPVSEVVAAEEWVRLEVLQSLVYNMRFVMKLVSDFYVWELLSEEDAAAAAKEERKVLVQRSVYEPWDLIESIVCSIFPRLLAFFYMCTNDHSTYVQSYRLYFALCVDIPEVQKKERKRHLNNSVIMCDIKTVTLLKDINEEFSSPTMTTSTHRNEGALFVTNVLWWIKGVDKRRIMTTMVDWMPDGMNIFGVEEGDFYRVQTNETINGALDQELRRLNFQYAKGLVDAEEEKKMSVPDAVNQATTRALQTLVARICREIRGLSDDRMNDRNTVIDQLNTVISGLCEWMPLVLVYLTSHCGHAADTAVPFTLYLTLCSDWTAFLGVNCPKGFDRFDDYACLRDAVENRLLMNFYTATGHFPDYDNVVDSHDVRNPFFALDYVEAVFVALNDYYAGLKDNVPVWTDSDWLTGGLLLDFRSRHLENPTTALKERTITLPADGQRPATEMLLLEARNLLLPWHSDASNVFAFQAVLFEQAEQLLDNFVYQHAEVLVLYLRHVADNKKETPSNRLTSTIGWYAKCAQTFHEELPGPREPRVERSVDGVVFAISNIGRKNKIKKKNLPDEIAKTLLDAPAGKRTELADWSKRQISGFKPMEYLKKLDLLLQRICFNAVVYVNTIAKFVPMSKTTIDNNKYIHYTYCESFVNDVFVTSVPLIKYYLTD